MKKPLVLCVSMLMFAIAQVPAMATAAEKEVTPGDMPTMVFFPTLDGDLYSPGEHQGLTVARDGKDLSVLFRTRQAFDAYQHTLPADRAAKLFASEIPMTPITTNLDKGAKFLVDPVSETAGGLVLAKKIEAPSVDNAEVVQMYQRDQADRMAEGDRKVDMKALASRDAERRARIMALLKRSGLATPMDYYRAALIMHHGATPEDYLMGHDLSLIALTKGAPEASWLAAASEDRFLQSIGRKQRYGTQLGLPLETDGAVSDSMRYQLHVPTIAESVEQSRIADSQLKLSH